MLYKEIIKTLCKRNGVEVQELAKKLDIARNTFYIRLRDSWNPGLKDTAAMLDELGYEVVFAPKGFATNNKVASEVCFIPELPMKPTR